MRTLWLLARAGMHSVLLFVTPWLVGVLAALFFDVAEVAETIGGLSGLFALFVIPTALVQLVAIARKVARERRVVAAEGLTGLAGLAEALDRHVRVLTGRGIGLLGASLGMVGLALSAKWAQFGVLAVLGLGLVYAAATVAIFVSAFSVQAFDERVRKKGGRIQRELAPSVVDAGDAVEERFSLARLPVPPGFRLQIHERLPERLGGETRFVAHPKVSRAEATISAPLPRTPRGEYRLGPATIWYEDVLGLTRVRVSAHATAHLRVLPLLRPVVLAERPRSLARAEGPIAQLAKLPTEDLFRFREYRPGDDTRRVHWKLSVRAGELVVRQPESVPYQRKDVTLLLDTYLPAELAAGAPLLAELLDLLVEGWVGLAHELSRRGEKVTLAVPLAGRGAVVVTDLLCRRGEERRWRALGAKVAWQGLMPPAEAMRLVPKKQGAAAILVSGAVTPLVGVRHDELTMIVAEARDLVTRPPEESLAERAVFFRFPPGAEDNRLDWKRLRELAGRRRVMPRLDEKIVSGAALASEAARAAGATLYRLRRKGTALSLEKPR